MRTVRFELLRPEEIVAERERCPVVYVPIGPLEWHSMHLPLGTDALNATRVALEVAARTGGVVMPTLYWGTERERPPEMLLDLGFDEQDYVVGMDFPKNIMPSLYCREEVFGLILRELFGQLVGLGYRLIMIVNGHGATNHIQTLERLCAEFTALTPTRLVLAMACPTEGEFELGVGHADVLETSLMMAMHPDTVDVRALPPTSEPLRNQDWAIIDSDTFRGHPTPERTLREECDPRLHASAELGRRTLQVTIDQIQTRVVNHLHDLALT